MKAELTLSIIEQVLVHGPEAIRAIARIMEDREPTVEEVRSLFITKDPEDYFNE